MLRIKIKWDKCINLEAKDALKNKLKKLTY